MNRLREIRNALLHLIFPHICAGCGRDNLHEKSQLCMRCLIELPATRFELHSGNPVEKLFYGRLPLTAASGQFYFNKRSLMRSLMHQLKYGGNRSLCMQLGRLMGEQLAESMRFETDLLIPLPLHPARERKRGYNQSALLCEGISEVLQVPVIKEAVRRPVSTETQTRKSRIERWQNMEGKFFLDQPHLINNKRVLLVDDVVTTGATLESCALTILKANPATISIATLCASAR